MNSAIDLINKFLNKVKNVFFFSDLEEKLYKYFFVNKKKMTKQKNKDVVLIQCVRDNVYFAIFGALLSDVRDKKDIQVEQYVLRNLSVGSFSSWTQFVKKMLIPNTLQDYKWVKLYSAYSDAVAYRHLGSTSFIFNVKALIKAYKIYKTLGTKEELLDLNIDDIKVGDLIYDSYLRFKPAPTVNINDFYLCIVIWHTIRSVYMTKEYFERKKPIILLTSYSTYIQHGIAVRVALMNNTKVYAFGNNQSLSKELTKSDWYHTPQFRHYKQSFDALENNSIYLEESKLALDNRLNGGKDIAISYMKESAYKISNIEVPIVKGHVVVFLHDFFDSPHIYGDIVFPDFLEWIEFTLKILEENTIPYSLKPHPNQIDDSKEVIEQLKVQYPDANFISPKITNKQLVDAGMSIGISVYGTVAHELVYMGVPVILCGENPHSSYNFCFEAKSKQEYKELIVQYKSLTINDDAQKEVESFYYMQNSSSAEMNKLMLHVIELRKYNYNFSASLEYNKFLKLIKDISSAGEFKVFISKLLN